jgi:5'-methylthioadenosine phosphorylase
MVKKEASIGVIGGSGLYQMEGLTGVVSVELDTPFGKPSDAIVLGSLEGVPVAFLPRHGRGHRFNPTQIPVRANIYALKSLGVDRIISVSAVGSLKEEFAPLDLVLPDQLIDRTRLRDSTFFDQGMAVHISVAEPYCSTTSQVIYDSAQEMGIQAHSGGTMVVMEGPAFSTKAESFMYRSWGAGLIGMTALPEAKLAREAEICYATMAWITDYDCWRESEEAVTVEMIIETLLKNVATSKELLRKVAPLLTGERDCPCASALKSAIITPTDSIPEEFKRKLAPIAGKYMG